MPPSTTEVCGDFFSRIVEKYKVMFRRNLAVAWMTGQLPARVVAAVWRFFGLPPWRLKAKLLSRTLSRTDANRDSHRSEIIQLAGVS